MKKHQMTLVLICIVFNYSYGQYGARAYPHTSSFLTSGKTTLINPGFVMGGIYPSATGIGADFIIEKTDGAGIFAGTGDFSQNYLIQTAVNCNNGSPLFKHGCIGVDVIETNPGSNVQYAVAGAFNDGVFFATMDGSGTVVNTPVRWPFGAGLLTERPSIYESANSGEYYICGTLGKSKTYVMKVMANGTPMWAMSYSTINLQAKDLIENGNELILVGRSDDPNLALEGFFMRLDANNGTFLDCKLYSDGLGGDEWFSSIEPAASTYGGSNGFIIGGRVHTYDPNLQGYTPWMLKVDPTGNVIWSTLIYANEDVVDVFERYNNVANPPKYEYYGVSASTSGPGNKLVVWKLDDSGNASYPLDKFEYGIGTTSGTNLSSPQIDFVGNGPAAGDGLVAFSTDVSSGNHVMVKAWYNGVNGCENRSKIKIASGPGFLANRILTPTTLTSCSILIGAIGGTGAFTSPCTWSGAPGGSNAKTSQPTGLTNNTTDIAELVSVYPNPSTGVFTIEALDQSGPVQIKLKNSIGQVVKTLEISSQSGNGKIQLDFRELKVNEGLYFMNVTGHNQSYIKKIMYSN